MDSGEAADLAIFVICCCLLLAYNLFYFHVESFFLLGKRWVNLYAVNKRSRGEWVALLQQDPKEGINAVQTVRNQVLATSILAASTAPLIASLVNVITDGAKLDQIEEYSAVDPITDSTVISPPVRLGIAIGLLFFSIMSFAQSVRLSVHVGYMIRVVASDPVRYKALSRQTMRVMKRSSLYFAVGLRLFFAFGPILLSILGPTTLLIATVLDLAAQAFFDVVPAGGDELLGGAEEGEEEDCGAAAVAVMAQQEQQQQQPVQQ